MLLLNNTILQIPVILEKQVIHLKTFLFIFLFPVAANTLSAQYRASEWEEREKWQNTTEILKNLDLRPSMRVADIGCHEGYITMKLSPMVGAGGKVYAVDIDKSKLNKLDKRLQEKFITNVQTVHGEPDDPKLPEGQLDRVIILDTYHEIEDHQTVLDHIFKALKPGGRLVMVEPIAKQRRNWSREEQQGKHEISMRFVLADLYTAGFRIDKKKDPFIDRPSKNDQMWMLVASKP